MFTVEFYIQDYNPLGPDRIVKKSIKTGKTTLDEAFSVALENGMPYDTSAKYIWED